MSWRWTLTKRAVTGYVVFHLVALGLWNLPGGPIRERTADLVSYYLLPTGLWQSWTMFAPDAPTASMTLEALTRDRHGVMRSYAFPRIGSKSAWEGYWSFRDAKYANMIGQPESVVQREFAARTVIRRLEVPPESFPVEVQLQYQVRATPPPGTAADAATTWSPPVVLGNYLFPSREEAAP